MIIVSHGDWKIANSIYNIEQRRVLVTYDISI